MSIIWLIRHFLLSMPCNLNFNINIFFYFQNFEFAWQFRGTNISEIKYFFLNLITVIQMNFILILVKNYELMFYGQYASLQVFKDMCGPI